MAFYLTSLSLSHEILIHRSYDCEGMLEDWMITYKNLLLHVGVWFDTICTIQQDTSLKQDDEFMEVTQLLDKWVFKHNFVVF